MQNALLVKATLLMASSLTVMAGALIAPALPQIADHYAHIPDSDLLTKLILTTPALFIAIFSPIAGWLIDRFGKIRILLASMLLYAVAGTAGWYLNDIYHLLISRALLGVFVAVVMTTATTLIGEYFDGDERTRFLGTQAAFMALGGTIFISISGALADIGWRYPFLVYGLALPVFFMVLFGLPEPKSQQEDGLAADGTPRKPNYRVIILVYLLAFLGMVLFYVVPVQTPFLMRELGVTQGKVISIALVLITLFAALTSSFYQKIKSRFSFHQIYIGLFFLVGIGYGIAGYGNSLPLLFVGMIIAGLGLGLLVPNANLCLINISYPSLRGKVIGGVTTAIFLGQFFSPIIFRPFVQVTSLSGAHLIAGGISMSLSLVLLLTGPRIWGP